MDRTKWNIKKIKGRWWLIRPLGHPKNWIAEHVGTFAECRKHLRGNEMTEKLNWTTRTIEQKGIELPWQRVERYGPILDTNGEAFYAGDTRPPKGTVLESGRVFIPEDVLYEVADQKMYDSQFGNALLLDPHMGYALEQAGLAVHETRGGYHGTKKLRQLLGMVES